MKMPFGKYGPHKGDHREIEDLPGDYIKWALENLGWLNSSIRTEMENQLKLRKGEGVVRKDQPPQTSGTIKIPMKPKGTYTFHIIMSIDITGDDSLETAEDDRIEKEVLGSIRLGNHPKIIAIKKEL